MFWCIYYIYRFIPAASLLKHLEEHHNLDLHSQQKNISFPSFPFLNGKMKKKSAQEANMFNDVLLKHLVKLLRIIFIAIDLAFTKQEAMEYVR